MSKALNLKLNFSEYKKYLGLPFEETTEDLKNLILTKI